MPTERFGKVRRLLKNSLAHVVCRIPFTIQLDYDTTDYTQPVSLGVDAGSKHIGISATTSEKELYAADVELRNDIVDKLSTRREQRRTRRSRLRYRKARFNNRVSSKRKGWLAPSVENKIQTHLTVVEKIHKFLPITNIVVETASFDIQKINNPSISGSEYQQGEQLDFFNVREYVLFRDNPTAKPLGYYFYQKKVRCQNRQIHKVNFLKGGRKKLNQAPFLVKGFRLFDLVEYQKELYYIFGRRSSGSFDIRKLDGTKVNKGSINCKYLRLIDTRKSILIEKRTQGAYPCE